MRIVKYSLLFIGIAVCVVPARAQQPANTQQQPAKWPSHLNIAVTYSADRTNLTTGNSFWMQGGSAEVAGTLPHGFSAVAAATGLHAGSISTTQVPLSLLVFTFGPRYTWRTPWRPGNHDLNIFGQVLLGEAHGFDSVFPSSGGATSSASSLTIQAGGGANLALPRHFSLRLLQAEWLHTQLPNSGTNAQNHLRISTGVALHF